MSLKDRFARPGPGVQKGAPRKKGAARFFEIVGRDLSSLFLAGLMATLGCVPLVAGTLGAIAAINGFLLVAAGLLGGAVAGPFVCGLFDTILRALRDEPGFWWHTYKRALAQGWRACLLPGALVGMVAAAQVFLVLTSAVSLGAIQLPALVSLLITLMIAPLWFAQIALMDLPFATLLKNSLILAFAHAPRTLLAAVVQAAYWGFLVFTLPWSLFYLPLCGAWVISLITLMILYPALDKTFEIEKKIAEKRAQDSQP